MTPALLLLLLETASAPVDITAPETAAPSQNCQPQASDEVVVCAPRKAPSPYRLPELSDKYRQKPVRAEVEVAPGATISLNAAPSELPGAQGAGLMVTFKLKF